MGQKSMSQVQCAACEFLVIIFSIFQWRSAVDLALLENNYHSFLRACFAATETECHDLDVVGRRESKLAAPQASP